jgi:formylglycine-generating enzyme required for sulfatase activity
MNRIRHDGLFQVGACLLGAIALLHTFGCCTPAQQPPPTEPVATPTFEPNGTGFDDSVDVTISCATDQATIRYTTDGTEPNAAHGTVYAAPIHLTVTTTLKARAFRSDMIPSAVATATYTKRPANEPPTISNGTVAGTLTAGRQGTVTVSCTAADTDGTVQSVDVDLTSIGGPNALALTEGGGDQWSWSGSVTPPVSGWKTVTFTATDDKSATGTGQASITVGQAPPGPNTLVLDLGNGVTMTLLKMPAGSFQMGTDSNDYDKFVSSRPVHTVTFADPFYIAVDEVTQAQWQAVMGNNPSEFTGDANRPVEHASWGDATAFCQALSAKVVRTIRLPSEAEWEYACKAGSADTKYYFGNNDGDLGLYAWCLENGGGLTHPVGQKLPNAFGLYDMLGNVWEWCQDVWHDDYTGAPSDGSAWTTGGDSAFRIVRGGSWSSTGASWLCRSANRERVGPDNRNGNVGFRVCAAP